MASPAGSPSRAFPSGMKFGGRHRPGSHSRLVQAPVHLDGPSRRVALVCRTVPRKAAARFRCRRDPPPASSSSDCWAVHPGGRHQRGRERQETAKGVARAMRFRSGGMGTGCRGYSNKPRCGASVIRCVPVRFKKPVSAPGNPDHAATLGQTLRVWKTLRPALQIPGPPGVQTRFHGRGCLRRVWAGKGAPPNASSGGTPRSPHLPPPRLMASRLIPRISAVYEESVEGRQGSSCRPPRLAPESVIPLQAGMGHQRRQWMMVPTRSATPSGKSGVEHRDGQGG